MNVTSREYKGILAHDRFGDPATAVQRFWTEVADLAATTTTVRTSGVLKKKEERTIIFLDTPDLTLRRHGLVLRRRTDDDSIQFTIKCRSEDRYFAAETNLHPGNDQSFTKVEEKLEEDIAPPFRCRLSHSTTVTLSGSGGAGPRTMPTTLDDATALFPVLKTLVLDGRPCPPETPLRTVHNISVHERVYSKADLVLQAPDSQAGDEEASVAVILWSNGADGRPLVAEFSFRIKEADERFSRGLAVTARSFFELLQRLDWYRPSAMTKTEYVYRDTAGD